jgi:hypothetical protein
VEYLSLYLFLAVCLLLMLGYPVAFTLAGTALVFAVGGVLGGVFDAGFLSALPGRIFGTINNTTLIAVPLFILMGNILEKSRVAEELLDSMARVFGGVRGGLGISVVVVGMFLAASTGIVGATVVTMGLLSLPSMLRSGYSPSLAAGTICATGTLGQIIPPSIVLVMLGDILSNAYQQAQLKMHVLNPKTISVGDLFVGALVPGLVLIGLYILYLMVMARLKPESAPPSNLEPIGAVQVLRGLAPPLLLISVVLGSIMAGVATPTEAAGIGAIGALLLAYAKGQMNLARLRDTVQEHPGSDLHGVHDTDRGCGIFAGVSRVWRRRADTRVLQHAAGRHRHRHAGGDAADLPAGLYPRFYRDHVRRRAHRRPYPVGHGRRSHLARHHDRSQPADLVSHPAVRICAVLPARRGALIRIHRRYLPGRGSLYTPSTNAAAGTVVLAADGNVATRRSQVDGGIRPGSFSQ